QGETCRWMAGPRSWVLTLTYGGEVWHHGQTQRSETAEPSRGEEGVSAAPELSHEHGAGTLGESVSVEELVMAEVRGKALLRQRAWNAATQLAAERSGETLKPWDVIKYIRNAADVDEHYAQMAMFALLDEGRAELGDKEHLFRLTMRKWTAN